MLRDFGEMFFFKYTSQAFSDWFFQQGLQAAGWATAAIAKTWINEILFADMESIQVPTLIIHAIHDKVVPFQLGEIQHKMIRSSMLVPLEFSGHGSFYEISGMDSRKQCEKCINIAYFRLLEIRIDF